MKHIVHVTAAAILGLALLAGASSGAPAPQAQAKHYVCVPCGLPCDGEVFDKPGVCPKCGMALVEQAVAAAQRAAAPPRQRVAILIFNGVEIIDYTGPWEVFGAANYEVYTVAATKDPVTTAMGMTVVPKYTFADAPQPDVLLIPGGGVRGAQGDPSTLDWIRKTDQHTVHTMSVCNGAFILASTGLLDGLSATTTFRNIPRMRTAFPKIKVVDDRRFVDNGKLITTAGLTAGIDGALHVVSRMHGIGLAQQVALGEEYDWRPDSGFVRAALADRLLPDTDLEGAGHWDIVSTQGGTDHWRIVARGTTELSATEVLDHVGQWVTTQGKWASVKPESAPSSTPLTSRWNFADHEGKLWTGSLRIESVPGKSHEYTATLSIARAG